VRCGNPPCEPNAVRAGWAGEGWRCYSLTPTSVDLIFGAPAAPLSVGIPRLVTERVAGSHSAFRARAPFDYVLRVPPVPDPPRLHGWRSLDRDHSDLWRSLSPRRHRRLSAPADRQLSFPPWSLVLRGQGETSWPAWPGPPLAPPVKETPSIDPERLPSSHMLPSFRPRAEPPRVVRKDATQDPRTDFAFSLPSHAPALRRFPSG